MKLNTKVLLIGATVVVPLIAFLAKGLVFDPHEMYSPLVGKPAPPFHLQSLDQQTFELAALAGRPVVVNFWSTWCAPCIQEHPVFLAAARHYGERVQFLGIVFQDSAENIQRFQSQYGSWGPSLVDPEGKIAIAYGVYGPPETFIIDATGRIVDKTIGAIRADHLKNTLDALL